MTSRWLIFLIFCLYQGQAYSEVKAPKHYPNLSYDSKANELVLNIDELNDSAEVKINGKLERLLFRGGRTSIATDASRKGELFSIQAPGAGVRLFHFSMKRNGKPRLIHLPLWLSIIPPIIAIILALLFKEVILALFAGVFSGSFIANGMRIDSPFYFFQSLLEVVETYIIGALNNSGHLSVIVFSLLIGGMVAVISRNGGMAGIVATLSKFATSPKRAQFITWLLGVAIFFDDYANTLIVGNTMRSVTDKFRVSREKLAYIVDSTAAPVSAIAFITTWIGAELGYIDGGLDQMEGFPFEMTPYAIFISSLKYSFYPILTLIFIVIIIVRGKDYGPMYKAEMRARTTGQVSSAKTPEEDEPNMEDLSPVKGAPMNWKHAFFPVISVIGMAIFGMVSTGMDAIYAELQAMNVSLDPNWSVIWRHIGTDSVDTQVGIFRKLGILIGSSDSYVALLWASMCGVGLAVFITLYRRIMNVIDTMDTLVTGFKSMMPALIILTLAWALAITTDQLHTANFLSSSLAGNIHPFMMPVIIFILSATIAFSTGSSWSTMAILYPIAMPTTWVVCQAHGMDDITSLELLLNVIATVLGASVLGDHCSPISDTTILSSLASDCNHLDHVRTQMPYALTVGGVSVVCCAASAFFGGGLLLSVALLVTAVTILFIIVERKGTSVSNPIEVD